MKKALILLTLLGFFSALGFVFKVPLENALKIFFDKDFLYAGTLEATKIDLSARLPSAIEAVNVGEGAHFAQGADLVSFGCEDFKVSARLANENYQRSLKLFKSGSTSREVFDQVSNRKQDADVKMDWCKIKAPIEGVVLSRYHEPGEWMSPGTRILTIANIKKIWAYVYVPQPVVAKLSLGGTVVGHIPEIPNQSFNGKIIKINDEAEFTPKNVQTRQERERLVFGIKISFEESNQDEKLKPGMTIEVALP